MNEQVRGAEVQETRRRIPYVIRMTNDGWTGVEDNEVNLGYSRG